VWRRLRSHLRLGLDSGRPPGHKYSFYESLRRRSEHKIFSFVEPLQRNNVQAPSLLYWHPCQKHTCDVIKGKLLLRGPIMLSEKVVDLWGSLQQWEAGMTVLPGVKWEAEWKGLQATLSQPIRSARTQPLILLENGLVIHMPRFLYIATLLSRVAYEIRGTRSCIDTRHTLLPNHFKRDRLPRKTTRSAPRQDLTEVGLAHLTEYPHEILG